MPKVDGIQLFQFKDFIFGSDAWHTHAPATNKEEAYDVENGDEIKNQVKYTKAKQIQNKATRAKKEKKGEENTHWKRKAEML